MFFTIGIPVVLFLVIGNAFKGDVFGVSAQTWYMVNMAVFGAIGAVLGVGARIADERDSGWNRQLRLTPLPPLGYVAGKVMTGMLVALPALVLVCLAGRLTGAGAARRPPSGPRSSGSAGWRSCRWPSSASGSATSPPATTRRR